MEKPAALLSQMPMELQTDIINVLLVMEFVPSYYFHTMCIYANTHLDFKTNRQSGQMIIFHLSGQVHACKCIIINMLIIWIAYY